MRPKFHSLRVKDVRPETPDCVSVAFDVPAELADNYRFTPGQYLTLRTDINGEDIRRSYSICSGLNDGELRVAIKKVEQGAFSTWACSSLKPGMELQVMTPMGHFAAVPDKSARRRFLLVAAGSGITPVMSIARSILIGEPQSEVTLIYGNRFFSGIIFRDQLEDMKDRFLGRFRVFHVLSGEPNEIPLFHGRIDAEKMAGFCSSFVPLEDIDEVYVCGPEPMIRAVKDYALSHGKTESQVHFELFATPGATPEHARPQVEERPRPAGATCSVSIIYDGQQTDFSMPLDGTPVLDGAKAHGLDIPFSCKGGMCCTCRAHLDEGEVHMKVNYALEPGEVEAGFILTCQAEPRSERVVIDFDKL
ncbi:MAG: 1,2-phenylacetyl-CoA epoxidase subunit PaaE [Flavobacteriales bacterium]